MRIRRTTLPDSYRCLACEQEFQGIRGATFHSHIYRHAVVHKKQGFKVVRDEDYPGEGAELQYFTSKQTGERVLVYHPKHPYAKQMKAGNLKRVVCAVCKLPFVSWHPKHRSRFCSLECGKKGRNLPFAVGSPFPATAPKKLKTRCRAKTPAGRRCAFMAKAGNRYCGHHATRTSPKDAPPEASRLHAHTPEGYEQRKALYEKYWNAALIRLSTDEPEMTLTDIVWFIKWKCETDENFVIGKTSIQKWYREYKMPQGFPPIRKGHQIPFRIALGVDTADSLPTVGPETCPDCGKPPNVGERWTISRLRQHQLVCRKTTYTERVN